MAKTKKENENPNDVKGRIGSVLDVMKKDGEVQFEGGMYALNVETPQEKPKAKRTAKKKTEAKEEPVKEEEPEQLFVSRPVFTRPAPVVEAPAPQPVQEPVYEEEVQTSRIDYTRSGKQVPAFLRRIRGDRQ